MLETSVAADYLVRRLRLRHLDLLVQVADAGTLRGAATRLSLSQPAISKMLSEIEQAFGSRLFERSRQGVTANALGVAAIHHARIVLGELSRATDELEAMRKGASALLRLGTLSVTAIVPMAIAELQAQMPRAVVQIREGRVQELLQRLIDGGLDCVFGAMTPEGLAGDMLQFVHSEVVLPDALCVLTAQGRKTGPAGARREPLGWPALRTARWVAPPRETLVRQAFVAAFMSQGLEPPVPVVEAMSSVTVGSLLRRDPSLLAAVRAEHARDEQARGGVRLVAVVPEVALPPLCLFTRRGVPAQTEVVRAFAQALRQAAVPVVGAGRRAAR